MRACVCVCVCASVRACASVSTCACVSVCVSASSPRGINNQWQDYLQSCTTVTTDIFLTADTSQSVILYRDIGANFCVVRPSERV